MSDKELGTPFDRKIAAIAAHQNNNLGKGSVLYSTLAAEYMAGSGNPPSPGTTTQIRKRISTIVNILFYEHSILASPVVKDLSKYSASDGANAKMALAGGRKGSSARLIFGPRYSNIHSKYNGVNVSKGMNQSMGFVPRLDIMAAAGDPNAKAELALLDAQQRALTAKNKAMENREMERRGLFAVPDLEDEPLVLEEDTDLGEIA